MSLKNNKVVNESDNDDDDNDKNIFRDISDLRLHFLWLPKLPTEQNVHGLEQQENKWLERITKTEVKAPAINDNLSALFPKAEEIFEGSFDKNLAH